MKKVYAYVCGSSVSIMGIDPLCVCKFIAIRASGVIFFQRTLAIRGKSHIRACGVRFNISDGTHTV